MVGIDPRSSHGADCWRSRLYLGDRPSRHRSWWRTAGGPTRPNVPVRQPGAVALRGPVVYPVGRCGSADLGGCPAMPAAFPLPHCAIPADVDFPCSCIRGVGPGNNRGPAGDGWPSCNRSADRPPCPAIHWNRLNTLVAGREPAIFEMADPGQPFPSRAEMVGERLDPPHHIPRASQPLKSAAAFGSCIGQPLCLPRNSAELV